MESKTQLTNDEKIFVEHEARKGRHAVDIAKDLNMTGHDMYISNDFCIAFSEAN